MPDEIFDNPRLAAIYDHFDGERIDLAPYLAMAREFKATSILDVGCGTGSFSCLLREHGFNVTGIDPAKASLDVAALKPYANQVRWILGTTSDLPDMKVDIALMTGNVAQVFLTDESWIENLVSLRRILNPQGHLIFEVRNPEKQAWLQWTREKTYQRREIPGIGFVQGWCEVTEILDELVSFRWTYVFESDESILFSDSTLRFRSRNSIEDSLKQSGYEIKDVREAPDRPGLEFVFIASCLPQ